MLLEVLVNDGGLASCAVRSVSIRRARGLQSVVRPQKAGHERNLHRHTSFSASA